MKSFFGPTLDKELLGYDWIIGFVGKCNVSDHLVDLEDSLNNDFIVSDNMLQFIAQIFNIDLLTAVLYQRLFMRILADEISKIDNREIKVKGDDIFLGDKKLSVSIATLGVNSCLFHFGINLNTSNIPTFATSISLPESKILSFVNSFFSNLTQEYLSIQKSTRKVLGRF